MTSGALPPFGGFEEADYRVFTIRTFAEAMAAIRARVTPKLEALGARLAPALSAASGEPFFAHVARHARRTVNPPPETWVAFGRDPRKYKPFAYLGVVVGARGVDVRLVLKDESRDKATLADALVRERRRLAGWLREVPGLAWYASLPGAPREPGEEPVPVASLGARFLDDLADALRTRKAQEVELGFGWPKGDRRLAGPGFERLALRSLVTLVPLYRLATRPTARLAPAPRVAAG
ncbi:MAG TPA: DUF1054 family protein [Thermodesulfobacteriota bacterium]|nr:DUF1054 family protein [Thermodesulfobacteriota bacterium]